MVGKMEKFILRNAKRSDLKSYWKNKNDKELARGFARFKYPYTLSAAKKDLNEAISSIKKKDSISFIIDINGEAIGEVGFDRIIPKLSAKISYWIGKDYRRRGIATKAVKSAVKYVFDKYKLRRVYGNVRTKNKASARVLEKAGFKLEGIQKKNGLKYGKYFDDYLYAKTK